MKKTFYIFILLLALLALCACGRKSDTSTDTVPFTAAPATVEPTAVPTVEPTVEPTAEIVYVEPANPTPEIVYVTPAPTQNIVIVTTPVPTNNIVIVTTPTPQQQTIPSATAYAGIIGTYTTALANGWDIQTCMNNGINYLVGYYSQNDPHSLGYCFMDVDNNGIEELIIGSTNQIIAMYTLVNSTPVQVIDAGERSAYYLEPDGVIVNSGSSSAFYHSYGLYKLNGATLKLSGAIIADYSVNEQSPWFYTEDNDWNVANDKKVSNETAEKWIRAYESNYVYFPFTQLY